jgi:hypothetical protein
MDTLTLCRKVAGIDGWSGVDTATNIGALSAVVDGKGGVMGKALLLDLMLKHEVFIDYINNLVFKLKDSKRDVFDVAFKGKTGIPRAILECIIEANPSA